MGFFSADLESMVELYQRETAELMEEFNTRQVKATRENRFSEQDINAVFRVVHTIKSSAAMMGLSNISDCSHRMEDLFLLFRDRPERSLGREDRVFELMDLFADYVEKENERMSSRDFQPQSAEAVLTAIQKEIDFFSGKESAAPGREAPSGRERPERPLKTESGEAPVTEPGPGPDETVWKVTLRANCQMENVRAFMLVRQIGEFCDKITTEPSNLEAPNSAEYISRNGLLLRLRSRREEEALQKLLSSPYVARVEEIGSKSGTEKPESETGADGLRGTEEEDDAAERQNKFSMVSWDRVTRLQNITGELITSNTILGASIKNLARDERLENEFQTMERQFRELEKLVMSLSMTPVSSVAPRYYRLIRDIAARENKKIRLEIIGEDIEADRNLLDTLAKPLIHLLRNAADHGIEAPEIRAAAGKDVVGLITLKFENLTDHLRVTVADDGAGMDKSLLLQKASARGILTKDASQYTEDEILNLAFLPGMSTNEKVNQYSGRGVGMDVARSVVGALGGSVSVRSAPGRGSTIIMEMPVSMTSAECIRFMVGAYTCLIPIRCVTRIYSFDEVKGYIQSIDGRMWLQADAMLPILDLFRLYGEKRTAQSRLIVIHDVKGSAALLSGPVAGQQTAVGKPFPSLIGRDYRARTGMIGCAVTETGGLGMMLNADWLIQALGKEIAEDGK